MTIDKHPDRTSGAPEIPEDPFLGPSLDRLSTINVPANFLPNVMYRVYEKNARQRLNWTWVVASSLLLLLLTVGCIGWDVSQFQSAGGHSSFSKAFEARIEPYVSSLSEIFAAFGAMINASWQLCSGFIDAQPTVFWGGLVLFVVVFVGAWWQRGFLMRGSS